ncbi:hypothetical protein EC968_002665 [Mortierella alpina]|nr:hypothetical protein EC968_002665 [Mortierella alpina]
MNQLWKPHPKSQKAMQDLGSWVEEQKDAFEEELSIMKIMVLTCNEIEAMAIRESETEDVVVWCDIARILFSGEMTPRIDELGSQCRRPETTESKSRRLFGGSESHIKSRKIDLLLSETTTWFQQALGAVLMGSKSR